MKKLGLTIGLCLVMVVSFGQKKNVADALKIAKDPKGNFEEARTKIKDALQHPETKDDAKTWFTAGQIENFQFDKESTKQILGQQPNEVVMYNALYEVYPYFIKAYELDQLPDAKGKVKPKYAKDMKSIMKANFPYYINGGAYFFENNNYQKAYDFFDQFVVAYDSPLMKDGEAVAPVDSNYIWANYYAAIAASTLDHETAIKAMKRAIKNDYKQYDMYQGLIETYRDQNDKENMETTLIEALSMFPNDSYLLVNLAINYIEADKNDKAIDYILTAIKNDPTNTQFYDLAGYIYENGFKDNAKAEEYFVKSVELNPDNADSQSNLGRIYFNQGVAQLDIANEIADVRKYNEERDKAKLLFKKALPYFEKSYQLNPEPMDIKIALRSIYYNLDMGEKLEEISKILGDE